MVLDEPELEFASGNRHIDPRYGIVDYGPADAGSPRAPTEIRVGLVGDAESIDGIRGWLERCSAQIPGKRSPLTHLFPSFPGFASDRAFQARLVFDPRFDRVVPDRRLHALTDRPPAQAVAEAVDLYASELDVLTDENRVDVIICARPDLPTGQDTTASSKTAATAADMTAQEAAAHEFHDRLKARGMRSRPIQLLRRETWDPSPRARHARAPRKLPVQDEATRAWNLHTALYYKAGGVPWRLSRDPADLASCYVGVSFYRALDGSRLQTSVAQVFNERGDGVIVRGGQAALGKDDRQPHLSRDDAEGLLRDALARYRSEHRTAPARVVLHKSSSYSPAEQEGFAAAGSAALLDTLELLWLGDSDPTRLFRDGEHAPLRGTLLTLDADRHLLYTRGSVEFFRVYPGMYIPTPLTLRVVAGAHSARVLAQEILALTKMNWNQTQFDGRLPITLRTARGVGRILRFVSEDQPVAASYAYYM
jgi:hypothetical protein